MAVDIFLKLDGIKGESTKDKHPDEIDILSFSLGAQQTGSYGHGGAGGGTGKSEISDITVSKKVCKASPTLFQFCAGGKYIPSGTIVAQKPDKQGVPMIYYKITMEDMLVSSLQDTGQVGDDQLTEMASFNVAKLTFEYTPQDKDMKPLGSVKTFYDIRTNKIG